MKGIQRMGDKVSWPTAREPICRILRDAYKKSSFTYADLGEKLGANLASISRWMRTKPPRPAAALELANLLNIDLIYEIENHTDAPYFWIRFKEFLDSILRSGMPTRSLSILHQWRNNLDKSRIPNSYEMRGIDHFAGDKAGFKEMTEAWYPYYYCKLLKAEKALQESEGQVLCDKTSECEAESTVKLEVPMDGTKEHPMTFYIHLDRVKAFVLEHGWSYIPDDLELYTSMVAAYAYQFFYGDSCDVLPRHLPTLSSEGGSYYYMSEDPTVGSCQIKSLKDFDFGGYLRARGVIPVITFDKEQDTMFRNLQ